MPETDDFICFYPAASTEWVVVRFNLDAPPDRDPFVAETILGWVILTDHDQAWVIRPIVGGESIEVDEDWIGVYTRGDLLNPSTRQKIRELCDLARAHRQREALS